MSRLIAASLAVTATLAAAQAQAQGGAPSAADRQRYQACIALTRSAPDKAIETANAWQLERGGAPARHCLAMAYLAQGKPAAAAVALEQAARVAETQKSPAAPDLWGQAGNAALLAGDAAKAHGYFSTAIVGATADGPKRGELLIDRARASVELNKPTDARADLDRAVKLLPELPTPWLLRATLARRAGDLKLAASDIAQAAKLAPDDPDVRVEQGNIVALQGDLAAARSHWQAAVKAAPNSPAGQAAAKALADNPT